MDNTTIKLLTSNRSFRYGDALFETLRIFDGKIPFLDLHYARLLRGMKVLRFEKPHFFTLDFFKAHILENCLAPNAKVRFTVFRQGKGLYTPKTHAIDFCIEHSPLSSPYFEWKEKPLSYTLYTEVKISCDILSNLKTANALPYVLASIFKTEQQKDECILLNHYERICEASSSNIFLQLTENELLTPSLAEGCLDGVMRRQVITMAKSWGWSVKEQAITPALLEQAQEIFISNSIQGVRPLDTPSKRTKTAKEIQEALNDWLNKA